MYQRGRPTELNDKRKEKAVANSSPHEVQSQAHLNERHPDIVNVKNRIQDAFHISAHQSQSCGFFSFDVIQLHVLDEHSRYKQATKLRHEYIHQVCVCSCRKLAQQLSAPPFIHH